MKNWSLTQILTSAYLSAMLTSGLAPIRGNSILASAVNHAAAQKALQSVLSSVSANGWAAASTSTPVPLPLAPQATSSVQPKANPIMNDELMARLIKLAKAQEQHGSLGVAICSIFNLCTGPEDMPVKLLETENPGGHFFMMPTFPGATDIIIGKDNGGGNLECYLTDKTFKLRAAAVTTRAGAVLITNEKAAEKYKAELALFAKEAADLPPTGTAVAGNS